MAARGTLCHPLGTGQGLCRGGADVAMRWLRRWMRRLPTQVVVAEGAPRYGGHVMARRLAEAGIQTTVIADSAVFAMMARANKVSGRRDLWNTTRRGAQHGENGRAVTARAAPRGAVEESWAGCRRAVARAPHGRPAPRPRRLPACRWGTRRRQRCQARRATPRAHCMDEEQPHRTQD